MPITRINKDLIYFAHVPKCAGTSVERYLNDRFGDLAFWDWYYDRIPPRLRWTQSSPQHVDKDTFFRLIPPSFLTASFAMVRHPYLRAQSVFHYQQEVRGTIAPETGFMDWLEGLWHQLDEAPFAQDNHPRPMCDFIPEDAQIFKLEEGGGAKMIAWLDELAGNSDGPRELARENARKETPRKSKPLWGKSDAEDEEIKTQKWLAWEIYRADYDRFGYDPYKLPG